MNDCFVLEYCSPLPIHLYVVSDFVVVSSAEPLNVQQRKPAPECYQTTSIVPVSTDSCFTFPALKRYHSLAYRGHLGCVLNSF